jgi:hypothetical protein
MKFPFSSTDEGSLRRSLSDLFVEEGDDISDDTSIIAEEESDRISTGDTSDREEEEVVDDLPKNPKNNSKRISSCLGLSGYAKLNSQQGISESFQNLINYSRDENGEIIEELFGIMIQYVYYHINSDTTAEKLDIFYHDIRDSHKDSTSSIIDGASVIRDLKIIRKYYELYENKDKAREYIESLIEAQKHLVAAELGKKQANISDEYSAPLVRRARLSLGHPSSRTPGSFVELVCNSKAVTNGAEKS